MILNLELEEPVRFEFRTWGNYIFVTTGQISMIVACRCSFQSVAGQLLQDDDCRPLHLKRARHADFLHSKVSKASFNPYAEDIRSRFAFSHARLATFQSILLGLPHLLDLLDVRRARLDRLAQHRQLGCICLEFASKCIFLRQTLHGSKWKIC